MFLNPNSDVDLHIRVDNIQTPTWPYAAVSPNTRRRKYSRINKGDSAPRFPCALPHPFSGVRVDGIDKLLGLEREVQRSQGVAHDLLPQLIIVILLLHPQREVALVEERSLEDALNTRGLLHTHKNVLSTQELFNQRHTSSLETFGGR